MSMRLSGSLKLEILFNGTNSSVKFRHTRPPVDATSVITYLVPLSLDRFDEMQVIRTVYLAENNISNFNRFFPNGHYCH